MGNARFVPAIIALTSACMGPAEDERLAFSPLPAHVPEKLAMTDALRLVNGFTAPNEAVSEVQPVVLPATGRSAVFAVVVTPVGARSFALDATDPRSAYAISDLLLAEARARYEQMGRMTPELFAEQSLLTDDQLVFFRILIRSDVRAFEPPFDGADVVVTATEFVSEITAMRAVASDVLDSNKASLIEWIESHGGTVESLRGLPLLEVSAPAGLLRNRYLHEHPRVAAIAERHDPSSSRLLGFAGHASVRETSLSGGLCGGQCLGGGLGVGLWEHDTSATIGLGGIAENNTRLLGAGAVQYKNAIASCSQPSHCGPSTQTNYRCIQNKCVQEHLTHVAASIGMRGDYTYLVPELGSSPVFVSRAGTWDINRYIANETSTSGFNWLVENAPAGHSLQYVNRSMSGMDGMDASAVDWASRNYGTLTTLASGNFGDSPSSNVVCSLAWSALCVGMYRYETYNSTATHRRHTDSDYRNIPQGTYVGQERPHLLGPGSHQESDGLHMPDITHITPPGQQGVILANTITNEQIGGTSFAAPAIMSLAMQAHQYEGYFSYLFYPTMKKAVLMAASVDSNSDGAVLKGNVWTSNPDGEDGAGHPDMFYVKQVLDNNTYTYRHLYNSSFVSCGTGCREVQIGTVAVPYGKRIRVAMAWEGCVGTSGALTSLPNDLDLVLIQPPLPIGVCAGSLIQSASLNNEVEMVHDACLVPFGGSGTYGIRVRIKNGAALSLCGAAASEPVAIAWSIQ